MSRTYHPKERSRNPALKLRKYKLTEQLERQALRSNREPVNLLDRTPPTYKPLG